MKNVTGGEEKKKERKKEGKKARRSSVVLLAFNVGTLGNVGRALPRSGTDHCGKARIPEICLGSPCKESWQRHVSNLSFSSSALQTSPDPRRSLHIGDNLSPVPFAIDARIAGDRATMSSELGRQSCGVTVPSLSL